MVIAHLAWCSIDHQRLGFFLDTIRVIEEICNVDLTALVQPNTFLKMDGMTNDRLVIWRKGDLTGMTRSARLSQKGLDEELIEEQILAQDEQLLATGRNLSKRVNFKGATTIRRKNVALVQPERLI